jgi:PAS domain S-box-containing protein
MTPGGKLLEGCGVCRYWTFIVDEKGEIEWSNPHCEKVIGFTSQEIDHRFIKDFIASDFNFEDFKKQFLTSLSFKIHSLPFRTKDGQITQVELFLAPVQEGKDDMTSFIVFAQRTLKTEDISKEKEGKPVSGLCRHFLNTLISVFPNPVFYTDNEARYIGWNKAFEEFFGLSHDQIYGKTIAEIFPNEKSSGYYQEDLDLIKHHAKQTKQIELVDKKNEKHTGLVIKTVFPDGAGGIGGMLGFIVDITPVKHEEEKRLRIEEEAQHAQKLASLALLAGGVAHDFNNILTVILGNIELAMSEISSENIAIEYLSNARGACLKAADLCRQMLIYTGRNPYNKKPINLNLLLQEMDQLLQTIISRRLYIQYKLTQPLPLVEADANQLKQAIISIVVNASEAMADKPGVITITTGHMKCDESYLETIFPGCRVGLNKPLKRGNYVFLEVTDSGVGIPPEIREKIFDPFFTTKFFGRGLGLAAVLGIVRTHRGGIKVYSEVGKGTTFKILLPAIENGELSHGHSEETGSGMVKKEPEFVGTVMIVDDEDAIREVVSGALRRFGLKVYEAANGSEALVVFNRHKDEIDFVFLDFTMPGLSSEEVFREMRLLKPTVKVVLCSGYAEEQAMTGFRGKGLAGFLQKPYNIHELMEKLLSLLPPEQKIHIEKGYHNVKDRKPTQDNRESLT